MNILTIASTGEFETKLKEAGSKLVVVDFYADWCGPCRMIAPKLTKMASEFDIVVFKVNVDDNSDLASQYNVSGIPLFAFFKDQKLLESFSGANEAKLKETIQKHL